jgi:hypothetical protein
MNKANKKPCEECNGTGKITVEWTKSGTCPCVGCYGRGWAWTPPRYEVLTWDADKQKWTPQRGVRRGPHSLWSLKRAIQKLRSIGYGCEYSSDGRSSDPSVLVYRL